jgi:predicted small lipoprotein YifL
MHRSLVLVAAVLASLLVAGCGSSGSSASPPAGVVAIPGDQRITVTWPVDSNVDYWLFYANASSISTANWTTIPGSAVIMGASSPYVVGGLTNGAVYSFTVNGRVSGGPGGPGSPSVSAIPRLAGTTTEMLPVPWAAGTVLGASDLRGVTWGAVFVAVGAGGAMYSSADGITWTAVNSGVANNLNAAVYRGGAYLAAGDSGTMLYSTDAINWTSQNTSSANNLYAVATSSALFVAVGANGTIVYSADGVTWTAAANSGTTNNLYQVMFAPTGYWIAVGANGTLLTSVDANTWTAATSGTARDLKGITYGVSTATNAGLYVGVGANGTLITSLDAANWTAQTPIGSGSLSAVTYGTQYIAVGASGSIFTSTDGMTWTGQPSTVGSNLNAIVHAPYIYSVVGAAGVSLLAQ